MKPNGPPAPTSGLIGSRILFLGAHADDLEIGCGGTAAKLAAAGHSIAFAQAADCGPARRREAQAAAALLKLSAGEGTLFFGPIPDGRLEERKDVLRNWLADVAERFQPDTVFVHRGEDSHPDHAVLYAVAIRTFVNHTLLLYPIPKLAAQSTAFQPNYYEDITPHLETKLRLCACHASQAGKGIYLDPEHLRSLARVAHLSGFGRAGGYAEAFFVHVARSAEDTPPPAESAAASRRAMPVPTPRPAQAASAMTGESPVPAGAPSPIGRERAGVRGPRSVSSRLTSKRRRRAATTDGGGVTMNIRRVTGQVIGQQVVQGDVKNSFGAAAKPPATAKAGAPPGGFASPPEGLAFIVSADLQGYSRLERTWANTLPGRSTAGVRTLRDWLDQTFKECCRKAGHELVWFQDQGDARFFPVAKAGVAHRIAEALHEAAAAESAESELQPPLRFRIGIARSKVSYSRQPPAGFDAATGSTAARLREKSEPGGIMICPHTWAALPRKVGKWYDANQVTFTDKLGQTFAAHRWKKGPAPAIAVPDPSVAPPPGQPAAPQAPPDRSVRIRARRTTFIGTINADTVNL